MGIEMFFSRLVKDCIEEAKKIRCDRKVRAMIVPHAGYIYSGIVAGAAYRLLKKGPGPSGRRPRGDYDRAIVIGPLHGSIENEHSVKVQIPFLQYMLGKIEIETILHGLDGDLNRETKELAKRVDEKTLVVASSDLSHYMRQEEAVKIDQMTIESILSMKADFIEACGKEAIIILNNLAKIKGWKPILVDYKTSGEVTGDYSSVVGYTSIVYTDNVIAIRQLAEKQSARGGSPRRRRRLAMTHFLLDLAKRAIESELENKKLVMGEIPEEFKIKKACFATLTIRGKLRGCIGHLEAIQPLYLDVIENARSAAFRDPRFWPLSKEEFMKVKMEISVLGVPKPFKYESIGQLLEYLRKEKPGVIVERDGYSATFLPQVWQELKSPKDFLSQLCLKARLTEDEWRRGVEIKVYEVKVYNRII